MRGRRREDRCLTRVGWVRRVRRILAYWGESLECWDVSRVKDLSFGFEQRPLREEKGLAAFGLWAWGLPGFWLGEALGVWPGVAGFFAGMNMRV